MIRKAFKAKGYLTGLQGGVWRIGIGSMVVVKIVGPFIGYPKY